MTITEIGVFTRITNPEPYRPFVYAYRFTVFTVAAYWISTFGAPDESMNDPIVIISVKQDFSINYEQKLNRDACIALEKSFFWDNAEQALYIHFIHTSSPFSCVIGYGRVIGFSTKSVYIDNIYYPPLIVSAPSFAQQQDIVDYDLLSFINGTINLRNYGGELDYLISQNIHGFTLDIYYLDDNLVTPSRSDMVQIASLFVDDYDMSLKEISVKIQDKRESNDADICTDLFSVDDYPDIDDSYDGDIIPLLYGDVRSSEAIPVDGNATGTVDYRQALFLTSIGTVQVLIDDVWTTKVPTATDAANGSFTLAQADARKGGAADGQPYKCRVLGSVGYPVTYASDVIKHLNLYYLGLEYNDSNYDTTEWEAEEVSLSTIGVCFNTQIKVCEAIRQIQQGANVGFRYEINQGKRTIRINDIERAVSFAIHYEDILNQGELPVASNKELLCAGVKVNYAYDYVDKKYKNYVNDENAQTVLETYRKQNIDPVNTLLTSQADAKDRADWHMERFATIPKIVTIIARGNEYFNLRIYDVGDIDITTGVMDIIDNIPKRIYYGRWRCQILSIDPDLSGLTNTITALLITGAPRYNKIRIIPGGVIRNTADNGVRVVVA
jgi:hypothetical protein